MQTQEEQKMIKEAIIKLAKKENLTYEWYNADGEKQTSSDKNRWYRNRISSI